MGLARGCSIKRANHKPYFNILIINLFLCVFLLATDKSTGKFAVSLFSVKVKEDHVKYNVLYNMTLTVDPTSSAKEQVELVKSVARASGISDTIMRRVAFDPRHTSTGGSVIIWGINLKDYKDCENEKVKKYLQKLRGDEFQNDFSSDANVLSVRMVVFDDKNCNPVVIKGGAASNEGLWLRILVPVIVIVVLMLIIALVLCCVYRRKRKANVQIEEDKTYLNHKKPVIFLEEFEEKPHFVSLQPLILPNEKPPAAGHPYEPRADTPEGPGSSTTVSTENEEKPLTPQSPKERKGYNAPPPYNSH